MRSLLRLHEVDGALRCRPCLAGSRVVVLAPREIELARAGWVLLRASAYAALFLWWARLDRAHPIHGLLSGVFFADVASWMLFSSLAIPFRSARFALELVVYAVLTSFLTSATPFSDGALGRHAMGFAALGFVVTFSAKAFRFVWLKLVRED